MRALAGAVVLGLLCHAARPAPPALSAPPAWQASRSSVVGLRTVSGLKTRAAGFAPGPPQDAPRRLPDAPRAVPVAQAAMAALLPTCLGYYKREYGVSYGYGLAMYSIALLVLMDGPKTTVAVWHAVVHLAYGLRLSGFLLWRETTIQRFRDMRDRIEGRAPSERLKRTSFILGCAFLYLCMSAPLLLTSGASLTSPLARTAAWASVATAGLGLLVNAAGDLQKSFAKASGRGLVTGGLFARLRHPNYTGEVVLWSASTLAAAVAVAADFSPRRLVGLGGALLGWAGILFILAQAATGLEKRQKEAYGQDPAYLAWVEKSWPGPTLKPKPAAAAAADAAPEAAEEGKAKREAAEAAFAEQKAELEKGEKKEGAEET